MNCNDSGERSSADNSDRGGGGSATDTDCNTTRNMKSIGRRENNKGICEWRLTGTVVEDEVKVTVAIIVDFQ